MRDKKIKIALLCKGFPWDKTNWSGSIYKIYEQLLEKGYEVEHIPAVEFTLKEEKLFEKIATFNEKVFNRTFNRHQFYIKAKIASARLQRILIDKDYDILFSISQINELAFLKTKKPVVFLNDALLEQMIGYYPYYKGLGFLSKKTFKYLEKKALTNCAAITFPSEWSAKRAHELFKIPKEKLHLIRFGANIDVPNAFIERDFSKEFQLLFLGVEWERKGGSIALEATEILRKKGYAVKLLVVGCIPPVTSEAMEVIPFLNKNNAADAQKIKDLLSNSHLLFVPTRAECYGIVFCEASAYSLPSIATDTGGVSSIIQDGVNGYTLPLDAHAEEYAKLIENMIASGKIIHLSKTSRERYEKCLSWENWGNQVNDLLANLIY